MAIRSAKRKVPNHATSEATEKITSSDIYARGCGYMDIDAALACSDVTTSALLLQCFRNANGSITLICVGYPALSSEASLFAMHHGLLPEQEFPARVAA